MMNLSKHKRMIGKALALCLVTAFTAFGQTQTPVVNLEINKPLERQIKGSETHVFHFFVKAGFYARAEVEQKNIDVIVSLFAPDSKLIIVMDGKDGRLWREAVSCIAEKDTIYRVEIKAYGTPERLGNYTVKLAENRLSVSNDHKRIVAEAHFVEGLKSYNQASINREAAIEKFENALRLWNELNIQDMQGVTLTNLGWTYSELSESERAITAFTQANSIFQKTGDKIGRGKTTQGIAWVHYNLNPTDRSRFFYEHTLTISREIGDKRSENNALIVLGNIYLRWNEYEKAREYFEESLKISQEIKFQDGEGDAYYNLGVVYANLNQHEPARRYYQNAVNIYSKTGNKYWQAMALSNIAKGYINEENKLAALEYYNKSLALNQEIGNKEQSASILSSIASIKIELEKPHDAIKHYNDALKLYREVGDREQEAKTLSHLGVVHENADKSRDALNFYKQALPIFREIKERSWEAFTLANIGDTYVDTSLPTAEALKFYEEALSIYRELGNRSLEAETIDKTVQMYMLQGESTKARERLEQALKIYQSLGNRNSEADTLKFMAQIYSNSLSPEQALGYFEKALKIYRETGNRQEIAFTLMSLAFTYPLLNLNDKALRETNKKRAKDCLDEASKILLELPENKEMPIISNIMMAGLSEDEEQEKENLKKAFSFYDRQLSKLPNEDNFQFLMRMMMVSFFYIASEDAQKALEYLNKSLEVSRLENSKEMEATMLMMIGLLKSEEDPQIAIDTLKKAEQIVNSLNIKVIETGLNFMIAGVYASLYEDEKNPKYLTQASSYFNRTLIPYREAGDRNMEAFILSQLMELWENGKNSKLTIVYGKQAVNAFQAMRAELKSLNQNLQDSYLQRVEKFYRKLADLLIEQGRLFEAQAVLDLLKVGEYQELARNRDSTDIVPYSQAEDDVIKKIENLVALERERTQLLKIRDEAGTLTKEQEEKLEKLRLDIAAANKAFDYALNELGRAEKGVSVRIEEIKGGQELQGALTTLARKTKSGVVALYTVLGADEEKDKTGNSKTVKSRFGWVIMVREGSYTAYPIDVTNLEETVFAFRETLSSGKYDVQHLSAKIYNAIFRQPSKQKRTLEQDLQDYFKPYSDKTIMWSLDGVLRYVPMAALHDGKQYLVGNYRNTVFTNTSKTLLAVENETDWRVLGLGVSEKRENFSPLPGVKTELEAIVRESNKQTGILKGKILLNDTFKKQMFFNFLGGGTYPVVHIASHYKFDIGSQENSFLLIGDGSLTFGEMKENKNLFGSVDLLTLSACDTGVAGNGKETEGFAYLAQDLGAKSVIASLWKVSDAGTPELMIRFYKLRAENPYMPKGEAFRRAQLSLLGAETASGQKNLASRRSEPIDISGQKIELPLYEKDQKNPYAHPHYWAPFVLIGNWR